TRFAGDLAFVESLYALLLNRTASASELSFWLGQLPAQSRTSVAQGFLASAEYRGIVVTGFFHDLLHRATAPSQSDVSFWVNGGLDVYSIKVQFAATGEFQTNG